MTQNQSNNHTIIKTQYGALLMTHALTQLVPFEHLKHIAKSDHPLLITGPSGSGKFMLTTLLHHLSEFKDASLIEIHCGGLAPHLLESLLFGHVKGAFEGAIDDCVGQLQLAEPGSILVLRDVSGLSIVLQKKLVQLLETKTFRPVGSQQLHRFQGRVIATTSQDLYHLVSLGRFREDLYYRLNVLSLMLPPLKQYPDDVVQLMQFFIVHQPRKIIFSAEAKQQLQHYHWHGNIRELRHLIDRLAISAEDSYITPFILAKHLPKMIIPQDHELDYAINVLLNASATNKLVMAEQLLIQHALIAQGYNKILASKLLGIDLIDLERRIKQHDTEYSVAQQEVERARKLVDSSLYDRAIDCLEKVLPIILSQQIKIHQRKLLFDVYHLLGISYRSHKGWLSSESQSAYVAALSIGYQLEEQVDITPLLFGVWTSQLMMLELNKAKQTAHDMLSRAMLSGNQKNKNDAYYTMANTLFWLGDCKGALNYLQRGNLIPASLHESNENQGLDMITLALTFEGLSHFQLGDFSAAYISLQHLILRSKSENPHAFNRALALQGATWLAALFENIPLTKSLGEQLMTIGNTYGFPFYEGIGKVFYGSSLIDKSQIEVALHEIVIGYEHLMLQNGGKLFYSFQAWKRANLYIIAGNFKEACDIAEQAVELAFSCDERVYLSELITMQARGVLSLGNEQHAKVLFEQALSVAIGLKNNAGKLYALKYYLPLLIKEYPEQAKYLAQDCIAQCKDDSSGFLQTFKDSCLQLGILLN